MASDTQIKVATSKNCNRLSGVAISGNTGVEEDTSFVFDPALADNISKDIFDCDGYLQVNSQLPSGFVFDNGEFKQARWFLHNPGG